MNEVWIAILSALAGIIGTKAVEQISRRWGKRLSAVEKIIVAIAGEMGGKIYCHNTDQTGPFISISGSYPYNTENPEEKTEYLDALEKLINKNFVAYRGGILFELAFSGRRMAAKLNRKKK
jgi:hypothetical protein